MNKPHQNVPQEGGGGGGGLRKESEGTDAERKEKKMKVEESKVIFNLKQKEGFLSTRNSYPRMLATLYSTIF
jgi:hypothetical protein